MTRGFVTIATGSDRYYNMARTLLRSYRQNCPSPVPFGLITDRQNEYTQEFDDVVILDSPTNSWLDKLHLLEACPYDENIFIDADCLIYSDINFLWDLYQNADDFSCFGKALPVEAEGGWFSQQAADYYPIHFCTHLHGILYFIRKSETLPRMQTMCNDIIANYNKIVFKGFNDKLADEPVYALAMATLNLKPVDRLPEYYCFVPYATKFRSNYTRRKVHFSNPTDGSINKCCIVHWGNLNTRRARYRADAKAVNDSGRYVFFHRSGLIKFFYMLQDCIKDCGKWILYLSGRIFIKIKRLLGK